MEKRIHADNLTLSVTKGPFPVDEAQADCRQIGERVEGVHKKGIIRCGLKPSKITFFVLWLIILSSILTCAQEKKLREPDVEYEPSPQNVVERMLKLANVHKGDVVYDLGCGDGRIVITAAKKFRATGVGIDIDPIRINESLQNARKAGVINRVTFRLEDLFTADIQEATVVALFLSPSVNMRLRPKLLSELKPGTRVVSYYWDMDDWKPDKQIEVDGDPIYLWTIPAKKAPKRDLNTVCESNTF
jgi:SAM-dependent methyltransferase